MIKMGINNIKSKKGDVSMSTLVMAIIAITVLLVVIVIFVSNVRGPSKEFKGISDTKIGECNNIIYGRECLSQVACDEKKGVKLSEYTDCSSGEICCEKGAAQTETPNK